MTVLGLGTPDANFAVCRVLLSGHFRKVYILDDIKAMNIAHQHSVLRIAYLEMNGKAGDNEPLTSVPRVLGTRGFPNRVLGGRE